MYFFIIIYLGISDSNDISPFEVYLSTVSGLLHEGLDGGVWGF